MAVMGIAMLVGMAVGGTANSVLQSTKGISDACDSLKSAEDQLEKSKEEWNKLNGQQDINIEQLKAFNRSMATGRDALKRSTIVYHNANTKKQRAINIGIVSLIIIVLVLIFIKKVVLFGFLKNLIFNVE